MACHSSALQKIVEFCVLSSQTNRNSCLTFPNISQTRYPLLENPEVLRKAADDFLNRVALTDAYLLFTPSQIALAAIVSSASRAGINIERQSFIFFKIFVCVVFKIVLLQTFLANRNLYLFHRQQSATFFKCASKLKQ